MTYYSDKQLELSDLSRSTERYILANGPVRSGKTKPAIDGFLLWGSENFNDHDFCFAAKSQKLMNSVIVGNMKEWARTHEIPMRKRDDHFEVANTFGGTNRYWPYLGSDKTSVEKVEGTTFAGALVDEALHQPQDFIDALGQRCSISGSRLIFTFNSGHPFHWLKTEYVDRLDEINGKLVVFEHSDNPVLEKWYVDQLHSQYTGIRYRQLVLNEWCSSVGAIYPNLEKYLKSAPSEKLAYRYEIAIDYGSASVTHALLFARYPDGQTWALKEWRHDALVGNQLTDTEQIEQIFQHLVQDRSIAGWAVDPAANAFSLVLKRKLQARAGYHKTAPVIDAKNDVDEGLQLVELWGEDEKIFIDKEGCPELTKELYGYIWDESILMRKGIQKPLKKNDHGCDALRYYCYTRHIEELMYRRRQVTFVPRKRIR